jgi:hypothetical protein
MEPITEKELSEGITQKNPDNHINYFVLKIIEK